MRKILHVFGRLIRGIDTVNLVLLNNLGKMSETFGSSLCLSYHFLESSRRSSTVTDLLVPLGRTSGTVTVTVEGPFICGD